MINQLKKTSKQWYEEIPRDILTIYDPDGWDRENYEYSFNQEEITKAEFIKRLCSSTIMASKNFNEWMLKWEEDCK